VCASGTTLYVADHYHMGRVQNQRLPDLAPEGTCTSQASDPAFEVFMGGPPMLNVRPGGPHPQCCEPMGIALVAGTLFVATNGTPYTSQGRGVSAFDPATLAFRFAISSPVPFGTFLFGLCAFDGQLVVADPTREQLQAFAPEDGSFLREVGLGEHPSGVASLGATRPASPHERSDERLIVTCARRLRILGQRFELMQVVVFEVSSPRLCISGVCVAQEAVRRDQAPRQLVWLCGTDLIPSPMIVSAGSDARFHQHEAGELLKLGW